MEPKSLVPAEGGSFHLKNDTKIGKFGRGGFRFSMGFTCIKLHGFREYFMMQSSNLSMINETAFETIV